MKTTAALLMASVVLLVGLGIVILASTSGVQGEMLYGDAYFFLKRQAIWMTLGIVLAVFTVRFPYMFWRQLAIPLALVSLVLLGMVLIPGIGVEIKGSSRWLRFGGINVQPSELAKLSVVVWLSWWMAIFYRRSHEVVRGWFAPLVVLGLFAGLILLEPDYGTTALLGFVGLLIMFMGGTRLGYLVVTGLVGAVGFALMVAQNPVRRMRVLAFLEPEKYQAAESYQLTQALYAFGLGGQTGVGLGESVQKRHYLPEAHTDFILAILGEELGFVFTLGVVILFIVILACGLNISRRAVDPFGRLLAFGITAMITLQAALNIGVVTGSLPTKGIALPFLSFGGSSLVMTMAMIGILLNISRYAADPFDRAEDRVIKDRTLDF